MKISTYDEMLDIVDGFFKRFQKDDDKPRAGSTKGQLLQEAMKRTDNIVGRFDSLEKIPTRELLDPANAKEIAYLEKLGAVKNSAGKWIVPEDIELTDDFDTWWPDVAADLRDRTPRLLTTRNGRAVESYVLPEDRAKGADSTATSLMYGGIALVSALVFLGGSIWWPLGVLVALLYIPFVFSLAQGEGPMEAAKSLILLGLLPLALATGSSKLGSIGGGMLGMLKGGGGMFGGVIALFIMFACVFLGSFILASFDRNRSDSLIGGTFQKFKSITKWTVAYLLGYVAVSSILPGFMQPFFYLAMPAIYPMIYTNANFVRRAKLLKEHGERFNLGRMGALASVHVEPKKMQAMNAFNDKTPLFDIGTAIGWLTAKHFPYAPDEGVEMRLSAHDLSKHLLCFGETGIGKSTVIARPIAKQWIESGYGGFLCLDGKGALPGDLSSLIDVMITPGVDFAPLQGLDGNGISTALNSTAKANGGGNDNHAVWERGADEYVIRCCVLFFALHEHEKTYMAHAAEMASVKDMEIDSARVEIARLDMLGEDTSEAMAKLNRARDEHDTWSIIRDGNRKWRLNIDTLVKVFNMVNAPVKGQQGWEASPLLKEAVKFLGVEDTEEKQERRKTKQPATVHPLVGEQGTLDGAIEFALNTWTSYEPQQRSSFIINVNQRVLPLTTDPHLIGKSGRHWKTLEAGVDAGGCLYGKSVGVDLPEERHQQSGLLIAALVKQRVYGSVALRGGMTDWTSEGQKPLMVMIDECQDLVSDAERQLLPKARSLGLCAVMLTQEWAGLENKLGNPMKALQFCNTFQNYVVLRTSPATYQYIADRLGTAPMLEYVQQAVGLDMDAGVKALANSPLNDLDHPNRAAMRQMERQGAGKLVVQAFLPQTKIGNKWAGHALVNIDDDTLTKNIVVPQGGQLKVQPIFLPEEYSALTSFGQAIVILNRAGERRIDVAKMHPVHADELRKKVA